MAKASDECGKGGLNWEKEPCHVRAKEAVLGTPEKRPAEPLFDNFEYFQDKEDDLHRNYNDRAYLSSEDMARDDSRTDFVALLTSGSEPWVPASNAVAKGRFSLVRSSLLFSINYERNYQESPILGGGKKRKEVR
ncbi:UNVERIFIED_CONTAM: hypothetical protein K2H54_061697 [Gekko kuhli]